MGDGTTRRPRAATATRTAPADDAAASPLAASDEEIARLDRQQTIALRRRYAEVLLRVLIGQLVVADLVFVLYAWLGRDWRLSTAVVDSWLAATFLEVTAIVVLIVKYLFPDARAAPAAG